MVLSLLAIMSMTPPTTWLTPSAHPFWGTQKGIKVGIPPFGVPNVPHGLLQIMYPTLKGGKDDLINFIAIEPIVKGQRGYSELEHSALDNRPGKRLWCGQLVGTQKNGTLKFTIHVEKFENGAHVSLDVTIYEARPDEVQLTIHAEPDSAPIEQCILTATMGNKARTRVLYLKDRALFSYDLWPNYRDSHFSPSLGYGVDRLLKTKEEAILVAITNDEKRPQDAKQLAGSEGWAYRGLPVTQYWRTLPGRSHPNLEAWVNGRFTYWGNLQPIPGGIAYENFELREPFVDGQTFIFGITRQSPKQLGFTYRTP